MFDVPDAFLPAIMRAHARSDPGKTALICADETVSWGELERRMATFARGLASRGIGAGACVGVLAEPGAAAIVAQFGAIKAGACVASLSGMVSGESLASMVADSDARLLIVDEHFRPTVEALLPRLPAGLGLILIGPRRDGWESFDDTLRSGDDGDFQPPIDGDRPYVLIYSSGTTSTPKGIVLTHRCRLANASVLAIEMRYDSRAVVLAATALYSHTTWSLLNLAFLVGGTAVVMRRFDAAEAVRLIETHRVSHTIMVPAQLRMILDAGDGDLSSIRALCTTGSTMPLHLKRRTIARLPGAYFEIYGLTEGLVLILKPEEMGDHAESVGRPMLGNDIRIVDGAGVEAARGARGEIVGYGPQLMAGYHKRPDATTAAIWREPATGKTFLRSGDIGYFDAEGFLHLAGRKKDMLVSGGYNVYPEDIERVLAGHPDVLEASVIGVPHDKWGETPFAYVVTQPSAMVAAADLVAWTNGKLGKHERLSGAAFIDALPRNAGGKVLKRELMERYARRSASET